MKTSLSLVSALALFALLAPAPAGAWSLFGSSSEAKLLERADEAYDAAMKAAEEQDALAELQLLASARSGYQRLADEYPSYREEHVSQRLNAVVIVAADHVLHFPRCFNDFLCPWIGTRFIRISAL